MISVQRILPYTKQLVLYALYDVLDSEESEYDKAENGGIAAEDVGTKTELGKYSGKYTLTELLFCGNCGTPYRRTTWSKNGRKKIVWRCISRLDYGTKYCKNSELTSMDSESVQNGDFDELFERLYTEMYAIKDELEDAEKTNAKLDAAVNRIDEMTTVMYGLKNHPVEYDEQIVRQLISSIKVVSAEQILILFKDGTEMTADL